MLYIWQWLNIQNVIGTFTTQPHSHKSGWNMGKGLEKKFSKKHPNFLQIRTCSRSINIIQFSQLLSHVRLFATPWIAARQASLSITNSRSSLRVTSIKSVMLSSHLILCRPLLLPPIPPSIRVFSNESTLPMRWPKYGSFSFSIIPSKEIPGLIDLLQNGLVGSPCSSRDSQESSPTLQFKSINYSVLSLLHSPTLTSMHDHWKNHSLD